MTREEIMARLERAKELRMELAQVEYDIAVAALGNNPKPKMAMRVHPKKAAKANGRPKISQEKIDKAIKLLKKRTLTLKQIAEKVGISESKVYRIKVENNLAGRKVKKAKKIKKMVRKKVGTQKTLASVVLKHTKKLLQANNDVNAETIRQIEEIKEGPWAESSVGSTFSKVANAAYRTGAAVKVSHRPLIIRRRNISKVKKLKEKHL